MRISQMNSEQGADVLMQIMGPVCAMLADREVVTLIDGLHGLDSENPIEGLTAAVMRILPYLLKTHRKDTFAIIGALSGKTAEQIAQQKFLDTVRDVVDSADKDLLDFFTSLRKQTKEAGTD